MYKFDIQLEKGELQEKRLDVFFSKWYTIRKTSRQMQRAGIDRVYRRNGKETRIEYKSDWTASKTGNVFIETVSVDSENKPGWAYTSRADILIYLLPDDDLVYVVKMKDIRSHIKEWAKRYSEKSIQNQGYCTRGLPVPQMEFEKLAVQVLVI